MKEKKINVTIAESWDALTDNQVKRLATLFYEGKSTPRLFDAEIFMIMMDWRKNDAALILQDVPVSELKSFYKFIYDSHGRTKFTSQLKTGGRIYYPPMAKLQNLTAAEFAAAEDLHRIWITKRNREALEYLTAVLYIDTRKATRPPFQILELEQKRQLFKGVPLQELLAIELVYAGCKEFIAKRYPTAFPNAPATKGKAAKSAGFGEVILGMAGGKFGDHDKTSATNIHTFLAEFEKNLKEAKKNKHE